MNMAEDSIPSAIAVAEAVDHQPPESKFLKRKQPEGAEEEQGSKRQRISPGKNSEAEAAAEAVDDAEQVKEAVTGTAQVQAKVEAQGGRRKPSIADEKQRSKRLFGALLGSLNQPGDRTSKRRQEIESRRKAELQRQDDEHVEDRLRRQEKLAEWRRREQGRIDEQNMHTRHKNLLHMANFLQTVTEPRLYYRPWELRPDEEDRIEAQVRDAQAQIDQELDEFEQLRHENGHDNRQRHPQTRSQTRTMSPDREHASQQPPSDLTRQSIGASEVEDPAPAKSEDSKLAEVPDSDDTNPDTNHPSALPTTTSEMPGSKLVTSDSAEEQDDVDHVVDDNDDALIY